MWSLIGRDAEAGRLHALIGGARGRGAALVLRGEPGIGKTALCAEAAGSPARSELRVLHTVGVESEARLPYAGLHQLLRPARDSFGVLPPRQREALRAALGIGEAAAPRATSSRWPR